MKLQRQRVAAMGECLVLIVLVRRQPLRAIRQIERVAMPMQHEGIGFPERAQAGGRALPGQFDLAPADFLHRTCINPAAKCLRHQLRTKADSEHRQIAR